MTKHFLHVGCGPIIIEGSESTCWLNIDKTSSEADILFDFTETLNPKFFRGDDSVWDGVFSCHCLEHCEWPGGVARFLNNALLCLKPGGTLRLVVPDLMKVAKLYVSGDDLKDIYGPDFKVEGIDCAATRFMQFCRAWEHTILFDERLLRLLMEQSGFVNIRVMPFGESDVPELKGLDRFESESLSIQCCKPSS